MTWINCPKCNKRVWRAKMGTLFNDHPTENEHEHQLFRDFRDWKDKVW